MTHGRIGEITTRHVVSAGEAAYTLLVGSFMRQLEAWQSAAVPANREPWPITLLSAQVEMVQTGTGYKRDGHILYIKTIRESQVDPLFEVCSGAQGAFQKVTWIGEAETDYGVAVAMYAPLIATDIIRVRFTYRERRA
jgi:hypothetical protein